MLREESWLAAPIALASLATAFAQFVERGFLARYSDAAVAAALPGDVLAGTFSVLITATVSYSATFVAQFHGAGRTERAVASFAQGLWLTLLSLPFFVAAVPIGCVYLDHAGHAAELLVAEKAFFSIAMPGGFLTAVSAVLSGLFLGQGRTRLVACANGVGCLVNVALLPWLVFGGLGLGALGAAGAAGARVAAALAVCLVLLPAVCRDEIVRANLPQFRWDARLLLWLVSKGLPEGVKSFVGAIAFLAFVTVAGRLDAAALAVGSVCFAVNNLYGVAERAIAQAVSILVGRARGAGDEAALRSAVRSGILLVGVSAALFFAVVIPLHAGLARSLYWVYPPARALRRGVSRPRFGAEGRRGYALHDGGRDRRGASRLDAGGRACARVHVLGCLALPDDAALARGWGGGARRPLARRTLARPCGRVI